MSSYVDDQLILEAVLSDSNIVKNGQSGIIGGIVNSVKNYYNESNPNPNDKLGGVINLLVPGILWALGFPVLGFIANLAIRWFGFDLAAIFESIGREIKSYIGGGGKATSDWVDGVVKNAVHSNTPAQPTQDDVDHAKQTKLNMTLYDAILYKTAITKLMEDETKIQKQAQQFIGSLLRFVGLRDTTATVLAKVIKWIVVALLASAGFLAADDLAHSLVGGGHSNKTQPEGKSPSVDLKTSTQTVLPVNPNYIPEKYNLTSHWIEEVPPEQIGDQIVEWAKEVYPDLKNSDSTIRASSSFNNVVNEIQQYNRTNTTNITFIPDAFTSKKEVVDQFIDDVAPKVSKTEQLPNAVPQTKHPTIPV